jgi:hypothetical protein
MITHDTHKSNSLYTPLWLTSEACMCACVQSAGVHSNKIGGDFNLRAVLLDIQVPTMQTLPIMAKR